MTNFPLVFPALALVVYMSLLFVVAVLKKDNSIADIAYGPGFLLAVWTLASFSPPMMLGFLLLILVTLWALRLAYRIYRKNRGKPEDFRYATWRKTWRHFYLRSFFQVFMLQGTIIFLVALPVMLVLAFGSTAFAAASILGLALWLIGFFFEVMGDAQLDRYLRDSNRQGSVMQTGLWRYTRHPNYFGESLMWWGIALAAFFVLPLPLGLLGFVSPVLITHLLTKVSGIPLLEARFQGNPEWEAYAARTNAFIPWFPRSTDNNHS